MIIVIGAGVAGLSCALAAVQSGADVELITRGELAGAEHAGAEHMGAEMSASALALAGGSTALAQGGIAAAIALTDSPAAHLRDTLRAGAVLTDERAARVLTAEGAEAVRQLIAAGFDVDRDRHGQPSLGLEAAHSAPRIVHAGGDRTGAALHAWLTGQVRAVAAGGNVGRGGDAGRGAAGRDEAARGGAARRAANRGTLTITEDARVTDLVVRDGRVVGVELIRPDARGGFEATVPETRSADAVVIASGGYAALYPRSSNRPETKGAGLVLAARAGALLADLEFVQFHPTVLAPDGDLGCRDLVSEAVRGAGAVLRDGSGERFMVGRHPAAELAPRDVVSREIHRVLRERGEVTVWLDATGIEAGGTGAGGPGTLARMFPGIDAAVRRAGLDWAREPIPVAPAAHYTMGGIATDLFGRTSVPGLFAAGEAAATGVHGANRLASNSLLEGLVFGRRAGEEAARFAAGAPRGGGADRGFDRSHEWWDASVEFVDVLDVTGASDGRAHGASGAHAAESAASNGANSRVAALVPVGVADPDPSDPDATAVAAAIAAGLGIERDAAGIAWTVEVCARSATSEAQLGALMAAAAEAREESRGAHQRAEFPDTDPSQARRRAVRIRAAGMGMGASATRSASVPAAAPAAPAAPSTRSYQLTN